jgi:hypothetical protein
MQMLQRVFGLRAARVIEGGIWKIRIHNFDGSKLLIGSLQLVNHDIRLPAP